MCFAVYREDVHVCHYYYACLDVYSGIVCVAVIVSEMLCVCGTMCY